MLHRQLMLLLSKSINKTLPLWLPAKTAEQLLHLYGDVMRVVILSAMLVVCD
jgi:hypothetical protein